MAAVHSRCCFGITIHGNDACYCYMHLQMFVVFVHNTVHATVKKNKKKNSEVNLIQEVSLTSPRSGVCHGLGLSAVHTNIAST